MKNSLSLFEAKCFVTQGKNVLDIPKKFTDLFFSYFVEPGFDEFHGHVQIGNIHFDKEIAYNKTEAIEGAAKNAINFLLGQMKKVRLRFQNLKRLILNRQ
jgi:hypothetical protein